MLLFSHFCVSHFGIDCLEFVIAVRDTKLVKGSRLFVRTLSFFARASRSVRHTEGRRALERIRKGRELLHSSNPNVVISL